MKINIGTLNIMTYDDKNIELEKKQYKFINKLAKDKEIIRYIPRNVEIPLLDSRTVDRIEDGNIYLVAVGDEPIGFVEIYSNFRNIYSMNYGIGRRYRNKGYGTLLLQETSDYLLKNLNCNGVRVSILDDNMASIRCAEKAGFELTSSIDGCVKVYEKVK